MKKVVFAVLTLCSLTFANTSVYAFGSCPGGGCGDCGDCGDCGGCGDCGHC